MSRPAVKPARQREAAVASLCSPRLPSCLANFSSVPLVEILSRDILAPLIFPFKKMKRREIAAIHRFGESILAGFPGAGVEGSVPTRGHVSFVLP